MTVIQKHSTTLCYVVVLEYMHFILFCVNVSREHSCVKHSRGGGGAFPYIGYIGQCAAVKGRVFKHLALG